MKTPRQSLSPEQANRVYPDPFMKTLISTSEVLAEVTSPAGPAQVFVSAEGTFDGTRSRVSVTLDCELRPCTPGTPLAKPSWLPERQVVEEHVPEEEATLLARDVFHHWADRVRRSVPTEIIRSDVPLG